MSIAINMNISEKVFYRSLLFAVMLFLGLFILISCEDTNKLTPKDEYFYVDDSNLSDSLKSYYNEEATRLALREIFENEDDSRDSIIIPKDSIAQIYFALVNVYNRTDLAVRDTVIDTFMIKTFPYPTLDRFEMWVDTPGVWVQPWLNDEPYTGNNTIDSLVALYNLYPYRISDRSQTLGIYDVSIRSYDFLNMWPLAEQFDHFPQVRFAEVAGYGGDGDDITVSKTEDRFIINYYLRWGDCPAGCIYEHWWTFEVTFGGVVEYIGEDGTSLEYYSDD